MAAASLTARERTGAARHDARAVAVWLLCCCGLIFLMIVVGGITRLTLSGLSITQWHPVIGVVPPLTRAQWLAEFARYQQVPEYRALHNGMSLAQFKGIFFWEYLHRLLGRLIGLAFAGPLVWFWLRGRLPHGLGLPLLGILALGFAQGLLGWYMVESGLADRLEVSQYRLVAHLTLALAIYSLILWTALGLLARSSPASESGSANLSPSMGEGGEGVNAAAPRRQSQGNCPPPITSAPGGELHATITPTLTRPHQGGGNELTARSRVQGRQGWPWRRAAEALIALVGFTIDAGGFVAGTRAGLTYNTFPLMDGHLIPPDYAQMQPFFRNWFENIPAIQFDHRLLAEATFAAVVALALTGWHSHLPRDARLALLALLSAAVLQVSLGISTLLLVVPIPLAAAHQAGAVVLLTTAIAFRHSLRPLPPAAIDAEVRATI